MKTPLTMSAKREAMLRTQTVLIYPADIAAIWNEIDAMRVALAKRTAHAATRAVARELVKTFSLMRREWGTFGTLSGETLIQADNALIAAAGVLANDPADAAQSTPEGKP